MATVTVSGNLVEVTALSDNWHFGTSGNPDPLIMANELEPGPFIRHIVLSPGTKTDAVLILRERNSSGASYTIRCAVPQRQVQVDFHGKQFKPYIDYDNSTLGTDHKITIQMD